MPVPLVERDYLESLNALARQLNAESAGEQAAVPEEAPGGADERAADGERAARCRTRRASRAAPPLGGIPPENDPSEERPGGRPCRQVPHQEDPERLVA